MQFLKKVISLILVVAMVSSFALVASADSPNILVELYDSDGQALASGSTVQTGDTIKVRLKTTENRVISTLKTFIAYDSELLECTGATLTDVKDYFTDARFNCHTEVLDRNDDPEVSGFAVGTPIVIGQWVQYERKDPIPANSDWIEYTFTALKAGTAELRLAVMEAEEMPADSLDSFSIMDQLITQGATVKIAAAPVAVESVTVSPASITLNPNGTQQLTATVSPAGATETVTWHSEDEEVATVSDTGLVTAVGVGDTTITATAGGKSGSCAVKVEAADVITSFEADGPTELYVSVGTTADAKIKYTTSDGSVPTIEWSSDAEDVFSFKKALGIKKYRVTGKQVGVGHLYAKSGNHEAVFTVNVLKAVPTSVVVASCFDSNLKYPVGRTIELAADVQPVGDWDITWTSSNPEVAKVDGNVLTTVGAGTATITASVYGKTGSMAITVVGDSVLGESNYSVDMAETQMKVATDASVSIPVTISSSKSDAKFNDFHMLVSYDPEKLEFQNSVSGVDQCEVEAKNGTIEITRYGDEKPAPVELKLQFTVKMAEGTTNVVLKRAQVDLSEHALAADAPVASMTSTVTTLEIPAVHNVTLPETMESSQGTTVADGESYTFSIKGKDDYHDYTVTATMGGADATVKDNGDGSYTIENVTGDLDITLDVKPKSYNVTLTGPDVTGESSATYGVNYTFTIDKQEGYTYEITLKIGDKEVTVTADQNTYSILGTEITGDVQIQVTKKDASGAVVYKVSVTGTGKDAVTAADTAKSGEAFTFTLTPVDGYMYTVEVIIGGSTKQPTITENEDGTKTYTVAAADVTGNIFIEVAKDEAYKVTFDIADTKNISVKNAATLVKKGDTYEFTVDRFFMVYKLNCEITEGDNVKTVTETVSGNEATRRDHKFAITNVQGDLNIKLSCVASTDCVDVMVKQYVNLNGKTVFLVAACTKSGYNRSLKLDTYDGYPMYSTKLYKDTIFPDAPRDADVFLWLTIEDGAFGVEQALEKLSYENPQKNVTTYFPEALKGDSDVNQSGLIDINDAQLVFDIYNGTYQTFYRTNTNSAGAHEDSNYGVGASMNKFLEADINRDMTVDVKDAAAVVAKIK